MGCSQAGRRVTYYLGVDPGRMGAWALVSSKGTLVDTGDMPVIEGNKASGHYDVPGICRLLRKFSRLPKLEVGIEWPQCREGEGAQRSRNFGLGLGYLEMACVALKITYEKIAPARWKNVFGLPSKKKDPGLKLHKKVFTIYFPDHWEMICGPRGGLKDGRLEAALIAEYMRRRTVDGLRATVERFGPDSPEAIAMVFKGGGRRLKRS